MDDREKVAKGLAEISEYMSNKADIAGVGKGKEVFDSWYRAAEDALALLREQEPVKPKWTDFEDSFTGEKYKVYQCGNCGSYLLSDALYCPVCGRKVKYEA